MRQLLQFVEPVNICLVAEYAPDWLLCSYKLCSKPISERGQPMKNNNVIVIECSGHIICLANGDFVTFKPGKRIFYCINIRVRCSRDDKYLFLFLYHIHKNISAVIDGILLSVYFRY